MSWTVWSGGNTVISIDRCLITVLCACLCYYITLAEVLVCVMRAFSIVMSTHIVCMYMYINVG